MERQLTKVLFILFVLSDITLAKAEGTPDWEAETLSGDWGGARSRLHNQGVIAEFLHKSDVMVNISGGNKKGSAWLANTEAAVSMDMAKLAGWDSATAFIQYHVQHGNQPKDFNGSYVGSFAGVDNIETGASAGQFYQAWLQKNLADNTWSLLVGLYAIDSEFYVTDTSGLFLQPPYGMSAEMAQTGQNGPPVFPMGALAMRVKYASNDFYVQGALTDGVPGNPANPRGTYIKLDKGDGTFSVVELGYTPSKDDALISKTSIGVWNYTAPADDLVTTGEVRPDRGFYVLAERTLRAEQGGSGQGLSGFIRFGRASKDIDRGLADGVPTVDWSGSVGLHYQGLFDGRDDDMAGIAVTSSHASGKYRDSQFALGNVTDSSETVIEMTYRAQLQPWLSLQPTVQRIINPNMDSTLRDAWVVGTRLEVAF